MSSIIIYLQNLSFKFVNVIFGKSTLFVIILGWYLVINGLLCLAKPEAARAKLIRSGFGILKLNVLLICFFAWGLLNRFSQTLSGPKQTIVFLGGICGLIFIFFWGLAFSKKTLTGIAERLPMIYFIWFASIQTLIGALMVYLQRRLW